jgi:hypothetical protein
VQPYLPTGREASARWRALSAEDRQRAWAAAKAGAAPPDADLALVMAGYSELWHRRLRWTMFAAPFVLVPLVCVVLVVAGQAHWLDQPLIVEPPLFVLLFGILFVPAFQRRRFRKLATAGALGLEAARAGALPAAASATSAGRSVAWEQSEFTVPSGVLPNPVGPTGAHAGIPMVGPGGVTQLRTRRAPQVIMVVTLSFTLLCLAGLVASMISLATLTTTGGVVLLALIPALLGLGVLVFLMVLLVAVNWRVMRNPVVARFGPEGWELPASGMRGSWADVTAIDVWALNVGDTLAASRAASPVRLVVLRVPDPERYLAQTGPLFRRLLRRSVKKYGSPISLTAGPRSPMAVDHLLATLAQYTNAPVGWAGVGADHSGVPSP